MWVLGSEFRSLCFQSSSLPIYHLRFLLSPQNIKDWACCIIKSIYAIFAQLVYFKNKPPWVWEGQTASLQSPHLYSVSSIPLELARSWAEPDRADRPQGDADNDWSPSTGDVHSLVSPSSGLQGWLSHFYLSVTSLHIPCPHSSLLGHLGDDGKKPGLYPLVETFLFLSVSVCERIVCM